MLSASTALRDRLEENTRYFRKGMRDAGFAIPPGEHPIVPVMLGEAALAQEMSRKLLERGVYAIGFFYPVVPKGKARIRTQISAAHNKEDLDRAIADGKAHGLVKVLTIPGKDRIIGATIVGESAGELIAQFTSAIRQGSGLNRILGTIHVYPTFSEANKYVAGEWKRAHAPERILRWVERYHGWKRG